MCVPSRYASTSDSVMQFIRTVHCTRRWQVLFYHLFCLVSLNIYGIFLIALADSEIYASTFYK